MAEIAHEIRMDIDLHPIYKQVDRKIMAYVEAAGIDNKEHWVEEKLLDLPDEEGISFD